MSMQFCILSLTSPYAILHNISMSQKTKSQHTRLTGKCWLFEYFNWGLAWGFLSVTGPRLKGVRLPLAPPNQPWGRSLMAKRRAVNSRDASSNLVVPEPDYQCPANSSNCWRSQSANGVSRMPTVNPIIGCALLERQAESDVHSTTVPNR